VWPSWQHKCDPYGPRGTLGLTCLGKTISPKRPHQPCDCFPWASRPRREADRFTCIQRRVSDGVYNATAASACTVTHHTCSCQSCRAVCVCVCACVCRVVLGSNTALDRGAGFSWHRTGTLQAVVSTATDLRLPRNVGNILTSLATVGVSRTVLHAVCLFASDTCSCLCT
jgi:hypothetical protein